MTAITVLSPRRGNRPPACDQTTDRRTECRLGKSIAPSGPYAPYPRSSSTRNRGAHMRPRLGCSWLPASRILLQAREERIGSQLGSVRDRGRPRSASAAYRRQVPLRCRPVDVGDPSTFLPLPEKPVIDSPSLGWLPRREVSFPMMASISTGSRAGRDAIHLRLEALEAEVYAG